MIPGAQIIGHGVEYGRLTLLPDTLRQNLQVVRTLLVVGARNLLAPQLFHITVVAILG